jgi:transcriptional regulator with XRE-family HTH domain
MNITSKEIGAMIKKIRKLKGLSQRALAKKAGVSNTTIVNLENNTGTTTIETLEKITAALDTSIEDIIKKIEIEKENGSSKFTLHVSNNDLESLEKKYNDFLRKEEKKIGKVIKNYRILKGFSQKEIADLIGVNATIISNIENGITEIRIPILKKIADALGVTIDEILQEAEKDIEEPKNETKEKKDLKAFLNDVEGIMFYDGQPLNEYDIEIVKNILEALSKKNSKKNN